MLLNVGVVVPRLSPSPTKALDLVFGQFAGGVVSLIVSSNTDHALAVRSGADQPKFSHDWRSLAGIDLLLRKKDGSGLQIPIGFPN
jgi:hypothetical protein